MKIASLITRILLGLVFTVFGLNGFLNFIPPTPMPPHAIEFLTPLVQSHYMNAVFVVELTGGVLLLVNQFTPLALTLLAPVIVNIVLFHSFLAPSGLPLAALVVLLWMVSAYEVRSLYLPLLRRKHGFEVSRDRGLERTSALASPHTSR